MGLQQQSHRHTALGTHKDSNSWCVPYAAFWTEAKVVRQNVPLADIKIFFQVWIIIHLKIPSILPGCFIINDRGERVLVKTIQILQCWLMHIGTGRAESREDEGRWSQWQPDPTNSSFIPNLFPHEGGATQATLRLRRRRKLPESKWRLVGKPHSP